MITEAFILAHDSFERDVPQPAKVQRSGYYPTKMRLERAAGGSVSIISGYPVVLRRGIFFN